MATKSKKPKALAKRAATTTVGTKRTKQRGEVVYPELGVDLRNKDNPLTVEDAKRLLGWITEEEATETTGKKVQFGKEYILRDLDGNKVRLVNNITNRPFRLTLSKRYANEILRGKWKLNGETMIIDKYGMCQDCQHRLVALVIAEQMRLKDPAKWRSYGVKGSVTMDALVVTGIDPKPETVDTINLGQKRTLGDVLFRNHKFGEEVSERDQQRLANILSGATRLAWLRAGGQDVSDAPHFPHSEALDFIQSHPRLIDAAVFVYQEDGNEKRISSYVSLGYAAALLYLLGMSASDPDTYHESGTLDESLWDKAEDFWVTFASGGKDLHALRTALTRIDASGAVGRDETVGTVIKAMNAWLDNKAIEAKTIKVKKSKDANGKVVLAERPRLGGIDAEVETLETIEPETETEPAKKGKGKGKVVTKKAKRSKGGWKEGDLTWVRDEDGDHWFGTIQTIETTEEGKVVQVEDEESGGVFEVTLDNLSTTKPK